MCSCACSVVCSQSVHRSPFLPFDLDVEGCNVCSHTPPLSTLRTHHPHTAIPTIPTMPLSVKLHTTAQRLIPCPPLLPRLAVVYCCVLLYCPTAIPIALYCHSTYCRTSWTILPRCHPSPPYHPATAILLPFQLHHTAIPTVLPCYCSVLLYICTAAGRHDRRPPRARLHLARGARGWAAGGHGAEAALR